MEGQLKDLLGAALYYNKTPGRVFQNLDPNHISVKLAAARYMSKDAPQHCLSCGEIEAKRVNHDGLIGLHTRNASQLDISRK